jgi:hypothetical protein
MNIADATVVETYAVWKVAEITINVKVFHIVKIFFTWTLYKL